MNPMMVSTLSLWSSSLQVLLMVRVAAINGIKLLAEQKV